MSAAWGAFIKSSSSGVEIKPNSNKHPGIDERRNTAKLF